MKKIGIYDPYLHILGGAERYVLSIVQCFSGQLVTLYTDQPELISLAEKKFGLKLFHIKTKPWLMKRNERLAELKSLDLFFYVTDGSLFYSPAKKNILIIQSPSHIPQNNLVNVIKFVSWSKIICYSQFMAEIIQKRTGKKPDVLFVPIQTTTHQKTSKKENNIISVGRFFPHLHNKKQKEMVETFKKLIDEGKIKNVTLYLVGSIDPGGEAYYKEVKESLGKYSIKIITNADYKKLNDLYARAKIYWHAAGFGEDLKKYPEKAEHFGVSTLEAMREGTVPVVFAAGGQSEIVTSGTNGFTWILPDELITYTQELLINDSLRLQLAKRAIETVREYTLEKFCEQLHEICKE